jgi:hypothetical protein
MKRFTFPVFRIPAESPAATAPHVSASASTKLPWMLPNISNPEDAPKTSLVKYFAELVTKMKCEHQIYSYETKKTNFSFRVILHFI